jgi:mono/diheme cytochrome c family protein
VRRRHRSLIVVLLALLIAPLAACGGGDSGSSNADGETSGQSIYESNCARCHGPNGEGGVGMPLGDGAVEDSLTLEGQIEVITNGRNSMPAWGDQLSDDQIQAVATYEREELGR